MSPEAALAEIRNLPNAVPRQPDPAMRPAVRIEAARAAQRAFFQAALHSAPAPTPAAAPVTARTAPQAQVSAPATTDLTQLRYARPGSRLDIKV